MNVNLRDAYQHYLGNATTTVVDEKTYLTLLQGTLPEKIDIMTAEVHALGFLRYLVRRMLEGVSVMLPQRCGIMYVQGRKLKPRIEDGELKGVAPDWKATRELWASDPEAEKAGKKIYHLNEHTGGISYRLIWANRGMLVPHKILYTLIFTRWVKRTAARLFKEGREYYVKPSS